jgi:hemoglobin
LIYKNTNLESAKNAMLNDLTTRADVELLVQKFYERAAADPLLAPHFAHVDWVHHFPRMIDFWAFILLDEAGFQGNVFDAHKHLAIDATHFAQWLGHFHATVNTLFIGEKAELAKQRADSIAVIFQHKIAFIRGENTPK